LETAQPKKKFDELVLLKGGSEAARAAAVRTRAAEPEAGFADEHAGSPEIDRC
jgi:hypothetical protein